VAIPVLDFKKFRDSQVRALRTGMGGGVVPGVFKGPDPEADGRALVEIGVEGNIVSVPHGGGVFPVGGEVLVQVNDDLVPTGLLAGGSAGGGETVALGATGEAIQAQGDKLGKSLEDMSKRVKAAAEGPVDTGRLRAGEVLIKGDLIAGGTVGARHIVASEELEAKLATFRKITTDEIVAGKAKISGSLLADTIEGKTLKGATIDGGSMVLRPKNDADLELHVESGDADSIPVISLRSPSQADNGKRHEHAILLTANSDLYGGKSYFPRLQLTNMRTRDIRGNAITPQYERLVAFAERVSYQEGSEVTYANWKDILDAANAYVESKTGNTEKRAAFRDLDRDWRREPREFELVKTAQIVDLFGGEWVRQNSEWNYTGNTWYQWNIIPEGYRPKQWVHFTVVITEDNFPHFAQGVIKPDGTFGLKLDKGIRVKPNVSRIMIPPVRWHL
jgi:hypothetical protein